jgi:hypothetical protein
VFNPCFVRGPDLFFRRRSQSELLAAQQLAELAAQKICARKQYLKRQ